MLRPETTPETQHMLGLGKYDESEFSDVITFALVLLRLGHNFKDES